MTTHARTDIPLPTSIAKKWIREPYAWPGGYEIAALTDDGAVICYQCARQEWRTICHSMRHRISDGWRLVAVDIFWEDAACAHCNREVSAYGRTDENTDENTDE